MRSAANRAIRALPTLLRIGVAETVAYRGEFLVWMLTSTMPLIMLGLWTSVADEGPFQDYTSAHFVAYYETKQPREVHVVGVGEAGLAALHAAALRPELFTSITLRNVPRDWASVVREAAPTGRLTGAVHGAPELYDLPDLARLAGADKVRYADESASTP